jgi:hypothetical protein
MFTKRLTRLRRNRLSVSAHLNDWITRQWYIDMRYSVNGHTTAVRPPEAANGVAGKTEMPRRAMLALLRQWGTPRRAVDPGKAAIRSLGARRMTIALLGNIAEGFLSALAHAVR